MWLTVLEWVGRVLIVLYAVITTIIAFKKKKDKGETFSILDIINYIGNVIQYVEISVNSVQKEGTKTGAIKKQLALQQIEQFFKSNGIVFDSEYVGDIIDRLVDIMNTKDTITKNEVHSNGQENTTKVEEVHPNGQETNKATFSFIKK